MRTIGNIIWFLFGGVFMGLAWALVGVLALISIIGTPWAKACFMMSGFSFFPFGKEVVSRHDLTQTKDIGTSHFGLVGNIIWLILAGFWLAVGHFMSALLCFVTIIGIPFGIQHLKFVRVSLFPIGKTVVSKELAATTRAKNSLLR